MRKSKPIISKYVKSIYNESFSRVLLLLMLLVFFALSSTSAILYSQYRSSLLDILDSNLNTSIEQVDYIIQTMENEATSIAIDISLDPNLVKHLYYFDDLNLDSFDRYKISQDIKSYDIINPYIHSVYIYNKKSHRFVTSLAHYSNSDFDEFFDTQIKNIIYDSSSIDYSRPLSRTLPATPGRYGPNEDDVNVFTFLLSESSNSKSEIERCIVINITEDMITDTLNSLEYISGSLFYVVDSKGQIILAYGQDNDNELSYQTLPILYDLDSTNTSQIIDVSDGSKYIVSSKYSEITDWYYIRAVPYETVNKYSNIINSIWILSILTLICIILVYIASKIIYKPIFSLKEKTVTLEETVRTDLIILRQQFLSRMIRVNRGMTIEYINENFNKYSIDYNTSSKTLMIIITIDDYNDFLENYEQLGKFELLNIASAVFNEKYPCIGIITDHSHIVLLINSKDENNINLESINIVAKKFQNIAKNTYNNEFSIAIDGELFYIDKSNLVYKDLLTTARYNSFLGESRIAIINYTNTIENANINYDMGEYKYPLNKERRMIKQLYTQRIDLAIVTFDEITSYAKHYSYDVLLSAINRITLAVNTMIEGILIDTNTKLSYNLNDFWDSISSAESFSEIKNQFNLLFTTATSMLSDISENNSHDDIIKSAELYIQNNYTSNSISSDTIASIIGVSTNYLRRNFKDRKNISISGYINRMRITKSEELLLTTDCSVKEIAAIVGFTNANYFYTYFKKQCGITPAMYKKLNKDDTT